MVLEQYIKIRDFSSGERITILTAMRPIAMRYGLTEVVKHIDQALVHERITRALDDRWAAKRTGRLYGPRVIEIDDLVDPVLCSIRDIAVAHTRALPAEDALVSRVNAMLDDLFPAGLAAVVNLAYVDQVAATEIIVDKLQTSYPALVGEIGLTRRVAYLAELTVKYRDAVVNDRELDFAQVKAMRELGQTMLRELVAMILGQFPSSRDPAQVANRKALLEPLDHETERARRRRARRRSRNGDGEVIVDEDPTSPDPDGEDVEDIEDADPDEPGQETALERDGETLVAPGVDMDRDMDMDMDMDEDLDLGEAS